MTGMAVQLPRIRCSTSRICCSTSPDSVFTFRRIGRSRSSDQVLRNIDVGSYYADQRDFLFSLLVASPEASPRGAEAVARYSDLARTRALLRDHRPDGLANLRAVTLLTWSDLAVVLSVARDSVARIDEQHYADRALEWMQQAKGLGLP